jgi:8-oxo-dGTP pyrophosphatase MutT (NUDIX family)
MGSGILPISIVNNNLCFLFGQESIFDDTQGYSDFGGGRDPGESVIQTAIREGGEELHGFLGNKKVLSNHLKKKKYFKCEFDNYTIYIILIDYDEKLPVYYNNHYNFLFNHIGKKEMNTIVHKHHIFEKQKINWFTEKEITTKNKMFRCWYRPLIKMVLKQKKDIIRFFKNKKLKTLKIDQKNKKTRKNKTRKGKTRKSKTRKNK